MKRSFGEDVWFVPVSVLFAVVVGVLPMVGLKGLDYAREAFWCHVGKSRFGVYRMFVILWSAATFIALSVGYYKTWRKIVKVEKSVCCCVQVDLVVDGVIQVVNVTDQKQQEWRKKRRAKVAKKLALFPLIYVLLTLPSTVEAVLRLEFGIETPLYSMVATFIYR